MHALDRQIVLSPHAALKTRADEEILVLPERAIRLGGSSGEILRLCDERRCGHDIVSAMRARYPDDPEIEEQVADFLAEMLAIGGLVATSPTPTKRRR